MFLEDVQQSLKKTGQRPASLWQKLRSAGSSTLEVEVRHGLPTNSPIIQNTFAQI